jgi:hypothetical protein
MQVNLFIYLSFTLLQGKFCPREAPCEGTNSPRLFTPGETKALAMTSQTAPDWQLQIGESGASSRYNFNMELERLVCKQTALAA